MKKMDLEEKEFHKHMAKSMQQLMKTFNDGYSALERAKDDEKAIDEQAQQTQPNQVQAVQPVQTAQEETVEK